MRAIQGTRLISITAMASFAVLGCQSAKKISGASSEDAATSASTQALINDPGLFELDKDATDDLVTDRLGVLSSQVNNTTTTSIVVCRQLAEPALPFTIQVDAEQMSVTAATGASGGGCTGTKRTYTVTRAYGGTSAATHASAANVSLMVSGSFAGVDWDDVYASITADADDIGDDDRCLGLGAVECAWVHDQPGTTIYTGGESKDYLDVPSWGHTTGSVPDADEILDAFAAKFVAGNGDQLLYFGADREATNGAKDFGFWFFQSPVSMNANGTFSGQHTVGDILILGTFTNGGAVTTIRVFEWVGSGGSDGSVDELKDDPNDPNDPPVLFGDCVPGSNAQEGCGTVNDTSIPAPWGYQAKNVSAANFIPSGGLVEGGINLTALGLDGCFSTFVAETRSSPEISAQLKDFVMGSFEACGSSTVTTPANGSGTALTDTNANSIPDISIGTGTVGVTDRATIAVTGISTWAGTVTFHLCGPMATGTCDSGGTLISSIAVTQASASPVVSGVATVSSAGRYCWRAAFTSTTEGVPGSFDSSLTECFEVLPVTPTLSTQVVTSPVAFGQAVQDNATISGLATQPGNPIIGGGAGSAAGGTITFTLYKNDCTSVATGTGTNPQQVTVSGNGTYGPVSFTPDAPGTYHWRAAYAPAAGDPNNLATSHNGACTDTNERVIVQTIPTMLDTRQFVYPQDRARVSAPAGGALAGSMSFALYGDLTQCQAGGETGRLYAEGPIAIAGASPQVATTNNSSVRVVSDATVFWRVTYTSTNLAHQNSISDCVESTAIDFTGDDGTITFP